MARGVGGGGGGGGGGGCGLQRYILSLSFRGNCAKPN
jgi:hypothetical protein